MTEVKNKVPREALERLISEVAKAYSDPETGKACREVRSWLDQEYDTEKEIGHLAGYIDFLRLDYFQAYAECFLLEAVPEMMSYDEYVRKSEGYRPGYMTYDRLANEERAEKAQEEAATALAQLEDAQMANYQLQYLDAMKRLGAERAKVSLLNEWIYKARALFVDLAMATDENGATKSPEQFVALSKHMRSPAMDQGDRLTIADIAQGMREGRFETKDPDAPANPDSMKDLVLDLMYRVGSVASYAHGDWQHELAGPTAGNWNSMDRGAFSTELIVAMVKLFAIADAVNIDLAEMTTEHLMKERTRDDEVHQSQERPRLGN
jgi:hypothetical protein